MSREIKGYVTVYFDLVFSEEEDSGVAEEEIRAGVASFIPISYKIQGDSSVRAEINFECDPDDVTIEWDEAEDD